MNENEAKYLLEIMEAYPTAAEMAKVVVDLENQLKEMEKLADYYKIECEKLETELEEWKDEAGAIKKNWDEMRDNFRKGIEPYTDLMEMHERITELESELSKTKELLQEKYKGDIFTCCECGGYHLAKEKIKELEAELESKGKLHKINLNDTIKVKLTPYGAEIYYHQFDDINKRYGRQVIEPHMPTIDKDGYTKFLLHGFMELYGEYMYAGARNVIEPIEIIACD